MTEAFVLGGVRTPVGRYGGSLSHIRTDDLLGQTMVWACERAGVDLDRIEDIAAGCVNPAHEGMGDIARWAALAAGFPDSVPAATVNRFCASSLTCAIQIAHAIRADELAVGLAGGVESMSRSGWAFMKGEAPFMPRGPVFMLDTMWAGAGGPPNPTLLARNAYIEMMQTAQNVADKYELSREEIDAFALRSHQHAAAARDSGRLALEIHPVEISATRKAAGAHVRARREHPRRHDGREACGASAAAEHDADDGRQLLAAERRRQRGRARERRRSRGARRGAACSRRCIRDACTRSTDHGNCAGVRDPKGTPASRPEPRAEIDVWEVHEAYASVAVAILRELPNQLDGFQVPDERLNPNGGAVAIGHPFGSSGTRYVLTLATELRERKSRYGVLGVCVGSGQGVALVLENPQATG